MHMMSLDCESSRLTRVFDLAFVASREPPHAEIRRRGSWRGRRVFRYIFGVQRPFRSRYRHAQIVVILAILIRIPIDAIVHGDGTRTPLVSFPGYAPSLAAQIRPMRRLPLLPPRPKPPPPVVAFAVVLRSSAASAVDFLFSSNGGSRPRRRSDAAAAILSRFAVMLPPPNCNKLSIALPMVRVT